MLFTSAGGATAIAPQWGAILVRKAYGMGWQMQRQTYRCVQNFPYARALLRSNLPPLRSCCFAEQGKLSLADEIGKYFPEYPVRGRHITIENLLTHTSGIRNYTEFPHSAHLPTGRACGQPLRGLWPAHRSSADANGLTRFACQTAVENETQRDAQTHQARRPVPDHPKHR